MKKKEPFSPLCSQVTYSWPYSAETSAATVPSPEADGPREFLLSQPASSPSPGGDGLSPRSRGADCPPPLLCLVGQCIHRGLLRTYYVPISAYTPEEDTKMTKMKYSRKTWQAHRTLSNNRAGPQRAMCGWETRALGVRSGWGRRWSPTRALQAGLPLGWCFSWRVQWWARGMAEGPLNKYSQ